MSLAGTLESWNLEVVAMPWNASQAFAEVLKVPRFQGSKVPTERDKALNRNLGILVHFAIGSAITSPPMVTLGDGIQSHPDPSGFRLLLMTR